ncbi:hypothetical protein TL16_g05308 [Triparma laevis f. inornata]|uniref:Uncharacterized protein n=1 Tax=Triparma laevis f. inornata TaxID=1714386 RepID=A0A9W7AIZ7_9STRA|nr:hypothetical protein TL16_g05308 [Triparma laevis f. inornata]
MFLAISTIWVLIRVINDAADAALEASGAATASIVINIMSVILTFLFESLTIKAVILGKHGPFMFLFNFGIDLMNAKMLLK